jgi:hypothetical protein
MMAMEISEYAGLITLLGSEILSVGQLYRDHADCGNVFDGLKNQWAGAASLPSAGRTPTIYH